jgi:ketosteroid isomerase-like protein
MKKMYPLFTLFVLTLYGCHTVQVDISQEEKIIQDLNNQWTASINSGNIKKIMNMIASDAVMMLEKAPAIVGKDEIQKVQESWFSDTTILHNTYSFKVETVEVSASGDLAYSRGIEVVRQKTSKGIVENESKWVDIWRKVNGEWKAIVMIGNSNSLM